MNILLTIFYFILFAFLINKISFFKDDKIPINWFINIFGLKIVVGIFLTSIYTYYYTDRNAADIYKYFDDSKIMFSALKDNPTDYIKMILGLDFDTAYYNEKYYQHMSHWYRPYNENLVSDTHIIIRFNAFVQLFSFGHFLVHNVFINFLSLLGLTNLYKAFKPYTKYKEKLLFYALFLIPSVLFWGSGVLKESSILLAIGLLIFHLFKLFKTFNFTSICFILVAATLLIYSKLYVLVAFSIPILGYAIQYFFKLKKAGLSYVIAFFLLVVSSLVAPKINKQLDLSAKIISKQQTFSRFVESVPTNSGFKIAHLSNGFDIIKNIPIALNNTFIRPYLWEANSIFVWFSALENHLILLLIIFAFFFRKKVPNKNKNVLYFNALFVFLLFSLIGLTTPVFGAIMRYKLPGIILLAVSLVMLLDIYKIKKTFPFLKPIL